MAEYIEKKYTKVDAETKEKKIIKTTYRVDKEFVPSKPEEICEEFIINFCMGNKKEEDWLFNQFQERVKDKNGKEIKKTFLQIRKEFMLRHFPNLCNTEPKLTEKEKFMAYMKAKIK